MYSYKKLESLKKKHESEYVEMKCLNDVKKNKIQKVKKSILKFN